MFQYWLRSKSIKNSIKTQKFIRQWGSRRGECLCTAQQKQLLKANRGAHEITLPT